MTPAGLPHSVIRGSQDVCSSPRLFAAYHDLLRQTAPRHPPWTRIRLTIFSLHPFPQGSLLPRFSGFRLRSRPGSGLSQSFRHKSLRDSTPRCRGTPKEVFSPARCTHLQFAGHLPSLFMSKINIEAASRLRFSSFPSENCAPGAFCAPFVVALQFPAGKLHTQARLRA